jgi:hypothetical protein
MKEIMSKTDPKIVTFDELVNSNVSTKCYTPDGERWLPARCLHYCSFYDKIKLAWMVFTGRADAFIWPEDQFKENNK